MGCFYRGFLCCLHFLQANSEIVVQTYN